MAAAHCIPELWTGLLLAGGDSSRMGESKANLLLAPNCSQTFLDHGLDLLRSTCGEHFLLGGEQLREGSRRLMDPEPGLGPMRAIGHALEQVRTEWILVLPIDMPGLKVEVVRTFQEYAIFQNKICAAIGQNHRSSFPVAIPQSCFDAFQEAIQEGESSLFRYLAQFGFAAWASSHHPQSGLQNLNTPAELKAWRSIPTCQAAL